MTTKNLVIGIVRGFDLKPELHFTEEVEENVPRMVSSVAIKLIDYNAVPSYTAYSLSYEALPQLIEYLQSLVAAVPPEKEIYDLYQVPSGEAERKEKLKEIHDLVDSMINGDSTKL
jgi:hypothetical protein